MSNDDTSDVTEKEVEKSPAGPRRSSRIRRGREMICNITARVKRVKTVQPQDSLGTSNMGSSCSTQLEECKEKMKVLEARIKLYEAGVTDANVHEMRSSQTNLGLVNVRCKCSSSIWGILEILDKIVVIILFLYIGYHCMVSYCNKRTRIKEQKRRKFMEQMEHRLRAQLDQRIIQLGPTTPSDCNRDHLHVPDRYGKPQALPQQHQLPSF